ncbi:MAG TPA: ATP-binding protein, partial [Roseiflexaceae bacterium]|nr:ATP-binding protein [Roseiflexaceae bacterium]
RQAEEARAQMQEEVVRSREQLTQMIIHDLKTPLTAVVGFLDMLKRSQLSDGQHALVHGASRSATRMDMLVATILDTARLAEGRMTLRREPTDIAELAKGCVEDLRVWAEQDMHHLVVDLPEDLPALALDAGVLQRVILNLLSNAIKHTPIETRIALGARNDDAELRLWVSDNGPGIPLEQQRRLFERFCVADSQPNRQNSTGLGLTFCKLAIEAHGGTITLESDATHGTTFTIVLPLALVDAAQIREHDTTLADDD